MRASTAAGVLLLIWTAAELLVVQEFSGIHVLYACIGVGLLMVGWLGHPDRATSDRIEHRLQLSMHDIADIIDPASFPASAEQTTGVDEVHAPGHQHVRQQRQQRS